MALSTVLLLSVLLASRRNSEHFVGKLWVQFAPEKPLCPVFLCDELLQVARTKLMVVPLEKLVQAITVLNMPRASLVCLAHDATLAPYRLIVKPEVKGDGGIYADQQV